MTILQANKFYYPRWGADRYVFDLSHWLRNTGHTVVPFAMKHPENLPTPYERYFPSFVQTERVSAGWQGLRTLGRMVYSLEARRNLAHLIADTKPAVAHLHNVYTQLSPSVLHTFHAQKVPVVMTVHDHHLVSPQYDRPAEGTAQDVKGMGVWEASRTKFHKGSFAASLLQAGVFAFHRRLGLYERFVDLFLCPSQYIAQELCSAGFPTEKIRVIPFGIDPAPIRPEYGHKGYVLFVGRLMPVKGVETLIAAARLLPQVPFRIVGSGPQEPVLRRQAEGLGNVTFAGYRSGAALDEEYAGALALAVPSRMREIFGLVALEAMARGKPVIASNAGALPEVVTDGHTGFLVPPTDVSAWASTIHRLVADESLRASLGRNARAETEGRFHVRNHWPQVLEAYTEVIRRHHV